MAAFIIMIHALFGKPSAPPAPMVGPVTAAIRTMRQADLEDRIEALGREIEADTSDDPIAVRMAALRGLIVESRELAGVRT